jgi:hypothetical protein
MNPQDLKPNIIVRGPMFPEPVKVIRVVPMGGSIKLVGQGMNTGLVHQPILTPAQLANLEGSPEEQPFDGDATKFKLGVEALRFGADLAGLRPAPDKIHDLVPHIVRHPHPGQSSPRFFLA